MSMSVVGARRGGAIAEINVTPMADVMIVLLIIFMVTVPILDRAPVRLPEAVHPVAREGDHLEIVVRETGEIVMSGMAFASPEALTEYLVARSSLSARPLSVLVQADRDAAYATVARGLTACRAAGLTRVALATERRPEGGRER